MVKFMDRLKELNCYFRLRRPQNPESNYIDYFFSGSYLEIDFPNICCPYDKIGCCTMCNYGTGNPITDINILNKQLLLILNKYKSETDILLIGTNGSVLDINYFQFDYLCDCLKIINSFSYNTLIFETHFSTITQSVLQLLRKLLPNKKIFIESGLESSNPIVQKYCYTKPLSLDFIKKKIQLVHESNMQLYINVLLGAPFLSVRCQKQDCLDTIRWIRVQNCYVVVFPLNIKPFTTIEYMYQKKMYMPISMWMLFDILNSFSADELEYIDVTWYGNRQDEYVEDNCKTIFPYACNNCANKLLAFFDKYNNLKKGSERFFLREVFLKEKKLCRCHETYLNALSSSKNSRNIEKSIYYLRGLLFHEAILDGILTEDTNDK